MNSKVTYEQAHDVLLTLGYTSDSPHAEGVVYRHPKSSLPIIVRRMGKKDHLTPVDVLTIQNALENGGILPKSEFDSLFQGQDMFYIKNELNHHIFLYEDPANDGYQGSVEKVSLTLPHDDYYLWPQGADRPMVVLGKSAHGTRYVVFRTEKECRKRGFTSLGPNYGIYGTYSDYQDKTKV
jgi:hypothetical protein